MRNDSLRGLLGRLGLAAVALLPLTGCQPLVNNLVNQAVNGAVDAVEDRLGQEFDNQAIQDQVNQFLASQGYGQ